MALICWAVIVAAIAWYTFGKLLARRALVNSSGKIPTPARYQTKSKYGDEIEWKIYEDMPDPAFIYFLAVIIGMGSLLIPRISWVWLAVLLLVVLSVISMFLLILGLSSQLISWNEKSREEHADGAASISYERSNPIPFKRTGWTMLALAIFWGLAT